MAFELDAPGNRVSSIVDVPIDYPGPAAALDKRNKFAPRSDLLEFGYAVNEGSGTALTNIGWDRKSVAAGLVASGADAASSSNVWSSSGSEGAFADFRSNTSEYIVLARNTTGNDIFLNRGTMMFRVKLGQEDSSNTKPILHNNFGNTAYKVLLFRRSGANVDDLRFTMRTSAGTTTNITLEGIVPTVARWLTIVITWGEKGRALYVEDFGNKASDSYTGGFKIAARTGGVDGTLRFGANNGPSPYSTPDQFADIELKDCYYWDVQLGDREIWELLADSKLPSRPLPQDIDSNDLDGTLFQVNPVAFRPAIYDDAGTDRARITFNCPTSAMGPGDFRYKILYRVPSASSWTESSASAQVTADYTAVPLTIDGLLVGQNYWWVAVYSLDGGSTYYPFPGGLGRFTTPRASGSNEFSWVNFQDDHQMVNTDDGVTLEQEIGVAAPTAATSAYWKTAHHAYTNTSPDFHIDGGDSLFTDNFAIVNNFDDVNAAMMEKMAIWNARHWILHKLGALYFVLGNHEFMAFEMFANKSVRCALTKQALITYKRILLMPDHTTYSEALGMESGEGGNYDSTDDWRPVVNVDTDGSGNVFTPTFFSTFIDDAGGEFATPLRNFYAWQWGDHLFIVLDNCMYADPAAMREVASETDAGVQYGASDWLLGIGGNHHRDSPLFRMGPTELKWYRDLLRRKKQGLIGTKGCHIFIHGIQGEQASPGSSANETEADNFAGRWYGRGGGLRLGGGSDYLLLHYAADAGCTMINLMHDHGFCYVKRASFDNLPIVHGGTAGANSHFKEPGGRGWPHNTMSRIYGTPESRHTASPVDADGVRMPSDFQIGFNCGGYRQCSVDDDTLTDSWIWTAFNVLAASVGTKQTPLHYERYVGDKLTPSGDGSTTLPYTPNDVGAVYKAATVDADPTLKTIDTENDSASNTDNLYTYDIESVGDWPADEPYTDGDISHESQAGDDVYILAVPKVLSSLTFQPVTPRRRGRPRHWGRPPR